MLFQYSEFSIQNSPLLRAFVTSWLSPITTRRTERARPPQNLRRFFVHKSLSIQAPLEDFSVLRGAKNLPVAQNAFPFYRTRKVGHITAIATITLPHSIPCPFLPIKYNSPS